MQLLSPKEFKKKLPLSTNGTSFIQRAREEVKNILSGDDRRLAIVTGPCSIHDIPSALEYAEKLKYLSSEVDKSCLLVMRVYTEKPRTRLGWKGLLNDPFSNGSNDLAQGLCETRNLLTQLADMGVIAAAELLSPLAHLYFNDLLSWGFIGARTSASQCHRELVSTLQFPVGFKNPTDGDLDTAINGVIAGRHSHTFFSVNEEGQISGQTSQGNPDTHIVLRGSSDGPNYDASTTQMTVRKLIDHHLSPRIMIDCAHGNASGNYLRQKEVFLNIIERIALGDTSLFGIMLESHLEGGNLLSKTDPCIDWAMTEELILQAHHQLCWSISCC
jgi:3-deoxy-7-phosphoheptulonate synthase